MLSKRHLSFVRSFKHFIYLMVCRGPTILKRSLKLSKFIAYTVGMLKDNKLDENDLFIFTRYKPGGLDNLCKGTNFTKKEIRLMYQGFKQECPTGVCSEEAFKCIFAKYFPQRGADTNQYAHYVFKAFDAEHTGSITFTDFVRGLSTLARGSIQDKLRWTFSLYDINNDGIITKDELTRIIISIYELMGKSVEPIIDERTAKEHVEKVFQKLDLNEDGIVTFDEFLNSCLKNDTITRSLSVFNTIL